MGYRSRLGRVAKVDRERYMGLSHEASEELLEESFPAGDSGALYRPYFHEQVIELGKYCQFEIAPEPFYTGFDIGVEESEFHILSKAGLKQIIREYHENVQKNYEDHVAALEGDDERLRMDALQFLKGRARDWNLQDSDKYLEAPHPFEMMPYYLDREESKRDGFIASSWQYEYQIFNLTYIYSTFDWENDYLIYSAW